jgi:hypothetical protein
VVCGEGALGERLKGFGIHLKLLRNVGFSFGKWRKGMEKEICTWYLAYDFNGRWLKDLSFLCCVDVLLTVEGKIV